MLQYKGTGPVAAVADHFVYLSRLFWLSRLLRVVELCSSMVLFASSLSHYALVYNKSCRKPANRLTDRIWAIWDYFMFATTSLPNLPVLPKLQYSFSSTLSQGQIVTLCLPSIDVVEIFTADGTPDTGVTYFHSAVRRGWAASQADTICIKTKEKLSWPFPSTSVGS